ncbi:hypothetical protein H4S07_001053 [Coemansia furcata]|uniref:Uncharacterized protein n=1 Tax=Coemansia furcata TaxID=417177 RepID=A0ACC1LNJ0_9FUNG|nr:hypothetical protein H4S07_001053 [Coemansia furcata]
MTAHSKGKEADLRSSPTLVGDKPDYSILAGEDFGFSSISGNRGDGLDDAIQRTLRRNCDAVLQIVTPHTSGLRIAVDKLIREIATDLEARMSRAARGNERANDPRGKRRDSDSQGKCHADSPLDAWVTDILEWTGHRYLSSRADSRRTNDLEARTLDASYVVPCYEAFLLFVAHHVREYCRQQDVTGYPNLENYRLILPITNKDVKAEDTDTDTSSTDYIVPTAYVDPADFANVECGMFSIDSPVERQAAPAPHLVVADAEMVRDPYDYSEAEIKLARKTKALFFNQHNRRFVWGLATCSRTIRAYVFGTDDIWASTEINISSTRGRRAFISLLVDWSLCSVDRLGFDPTIRYEIDHTSGDPFLAIDVVEMDESTGNNVSRTYYSQQCVGAADRLTGCHARYFTASASLGTPDMPTFLIKDVWTASGSDSVGDDRESSFLTVLHAEFDKSSEFGGRFSRLVSTGPVPISQGDLPVMDSTATAFAGLPNVSRVRQHRRTVVKWAGKMISAADNPSQVVVAVADAMAALNAAYTKCKIFHGNISDRAILIQQTADGVKGVLADFDYASYAVDTGVERPELMLFQSIRTLDSPAAIRTLLDDGESLLYLICWLGTFGANRAQRSEYALRHAAGLKRNLPILEWAQANAEVCARSKRNHLSTLDSFDDNILSHMRDTNGPLHPGAPVVAPAPGVIRDPLILRINHMVVILQNLLDVMAMHRDVALAVLNASGTDDSFESATPPRISMSTKKHYMDEPAVAGPSKRLRS